MLIFARIFENNGENAALFLIFDAYTAALKQQNLFDERQSESVPLLFMRGVCLIKFIENMFLCLGRDAGSLVSDRKDYFPETFFQPQRDLSADGAEFDGVADKVGHEL